MSRLLKVAVLLVGGIALLILGGCATQTLWAGPVVTNISAAGDGSVHVEKCLVRITKDTDWWTGSTAESSGLTECNTFQIIIAPDE